jgi:hypothetical protein
MMMQTWNNIKPSEQMRQVRGYAIISKGDVPIRIHDNTFNIGGSTPAENTGIGVNPEGNKWKELIEKTCFKN